MLFWSEGSVFDYHQHGNSPFHCSAHIGQTVLEIYPLAKGQATADKHFCLGFGIDDFDNVIQKLKDLDLPFSLAPQQTEFGYIAAVEDSDGRKIELYKNHNGQRQVAA